MFQKSIRKYFYIYKKIFVDEKITQSYKKKYKKFFVARQNT